MNSVKLSEKSLEELNDLRLSIENNPDNKQVGFHMFKPYPRKKLEDIAWAITYKLGKNKKEVAK